MGQAREAELERAKRWADKNAVPYAEALVKYRDATRPRPPTDRPLAELGDAEVVEAAELCAEFYHEGLRAALKDVPTAQKAKIGRAMLQPPSHENYQVIRALMKNRRADPKQAGRAGRLFDILRLHIGLPPRDEA